jgi:hypothetical protein
MSTEETDAKNTDAGQGRDIGSGGYPEEQPGGANPGPQKSGSGGGGEEKPAQSGNQDSDPAAATGNPGAAGGEG